MLNNTSKSVSWSLDTQAEKINVKRNEYLDQCFEKNLSNMPFYVHLNPPMFFATVVITISG